MILSAMFVRAEKLDQVSLVRIAGISRSQAGQYFVLMFKISRIWGVELLDSHKFCVPLMRESQYIVLNIWEHPIITCGVPLSQSS